jgi:Fe-S-cluster-containing hydrogenase component 2
LGIGKNHAKWNAGHVFFRKIPSITIKNNNVACAQACPNGTLVDKAGKLTLTDEKTCILCNACVDVDAGKSVQIEAGNNFFLSIESWGQVAPSQIVEKAVEVYNQELKEFEQMIKAQE